MVEVRQRLLIAVVLLALACATDSSAQTFYPDDPLWQMPSPLAVGKVQHRKFNDYYDFFLNTFATPGRRPETARIRAGAVNTLGEVPDSAWYTNRHGHKRMSIEELVKGPGISHEPSEKKPWKVTGAKLEGVSPGFAMEDAEGRKYLVKLDPESNPEMATGADVIGSKFFYALGYYTPENYIVTFRKEDLTIKKGTVVQDSRGYERPMRSRDIDELLLRAAQYPDGTYRAVASRFIEGEIIGPFRFNGVRKDDPNDIVAHENRRDLRGLYVFSAWLGHNDVKSLNTLDSVVEEGGVRYIRHYLIDFGAAFGSDSFEAKSPRAGHRYLFAWDSAAAQVLSFGLYVPAWMRANYPKIPGVGNFEHEVFDALEWKPNYPNPAFLNRLPDDEFWAARQVMRFTDEEIHAIVKSGQYSDPRAVDWLTRCLIERRDKIGKAYFAKVLPLDEFRIENGALKFRDLGVDHGFAPPRRYRVHWSGFNNSDATESPIPSATTFELPRQFGQARSPDFAVARIQADDPRQAVLVYLRFTDGKAEIVGIDRQWHSENGGSGRADFARGNYSTK